ncbi:MAG: hypothetical protein A2Z88_10220 [Omnitrophica WOR_2 bacterium GWA2_47_8]|nr:MAG: hypothetical protein A2Z88_10220 [Omnitrophica WOR_2 bacterium GWA2_47_8]
MQEKLKLFIPPLLLYIISFLLFSSLISKGPYHGDGLYLALQSEQTVLTHRLHYLHSHGYPFTAILGACFVAIFRSLGNEDPVLAVNFMSVLAAALSVFFFYFIVKNLMDSITAMISSMLLIVSPIFLGNAVYGNSHILFLLLFFITLLFLIKYQKTGRSAYLYFFVIFASLSGASRIQDLITLSPVLIYFFLMPPLPTSPIPLTKKVFNGIFILFPVTGFIYMFYHTILAEKFPPLAHSQGSAGLVHFIDYEVFSGIEINMQMILTYKYIIANFPLLGILLAVLGFIQITRENKRKGIFLLAWFLVPFSAFSLLNFAGPRFFIICLPPLTIAISYALSSRLKSSQLKLKILSFFLFIAIIFYMTVSFFPIAQFRHQHAALPEFAAWVGQRTEENASIIAADERLFIAHYANRKILPRPCKYKYTAEDLKAFKAVIDEQLDQSIPVYITDASLYSYDPRKEFSGFIKAHYNLESLGGHPYEDWHEGEIVMRLFQIKLYRLTKKISCCD